MGQYRKKPVVINAIQWKGWNTPEIVAFSKTEDINKTHPTWLFDGDKILIPTLEGTMTADKNDWIIKEPFPSGDRKFYPCKPDIFEATYECIDKVSDDNHLQDYTQSKGAITAPLMHI